MKDANGREWAKLSKLKPGDMVTVDIGFDCMNPNQQHEVQTFNGEPYLICSHGFHFLTGQLETDGDSLIAVYHT